MAVVCPVYKNKGKESLIIRGVPLLPVVTIFFSIILAIRQCGWLLNNNILLRCQAGFGKKRRNTSNIFVIKNKQVFITKGDVFISAW